MTYENFVKGDKVHVEFDGEVVVSAASNGGGWVNVGDRNGIMHKIWHAAGAPGPITRQDPANWPPHPGDVWKLPDGTVLVVKEDPRNGQWEATVAVPGERGLRSVFHERSDGSDSALKPLNPTLLYRLPKEEQS